MRNCLIFNKPLVLQKRNLILGFSVHKVFLYIRVVDVQRMYEELGAFDQAAETHLLISIRVLVRSGSYQGKAR